MKPLFTLLCLSLFGLTLYAQPNAAMRFAGPSTFGVAAMNAWQDNETDTIAFVMTSTSQADITLPTMAYKAMNVTIPSFTIHGLTFDFDTATRDASFGQQTYTETLTVEGAEKVITGSAFVAEYNHAEKSFTLETSLSYGRMPVVVTYKIKAQYVDPEATEIADVQSDMAEGAIYDLLGNKVTQMLPGRIYLRTSSMGRPKMLLKTTSSH